MAKEFKKWIDEFVENGADAKNVTNWPENAGGGSSLIEVPANSRITLNGNKLLQLLIAKGVDVDAEFNTDGLSYSGILLGGVIPFTHYLEMSVTPHIIFPYSSGSSGYTATWALDNYTYGFSVDTTILSTPITFKTILSSVGEKSIDITSSGIVLIPYLAVTTSSTAPLTPYDITTEEFLSFISITPLGEEAA